MSQPVVSILVPNYNNGRASSMKGDRDFIGDLFRSIEATLEHDPTPVEIIVADDGSTDDSLATCRAWARRPWKEGRPFLRLIELRHSGIVSRTMNRLLAEARGSIIARFDGDTIVHTPNWCALMVEMFRAGPPGLGVIGPKQLSVDGRIHAAGDWLLHPRGYHHIAQGAPRQAITRAIEVDHVMGCFYCHRREVADDLAGYDETILRGQTIDFGMRARLHGWRCFSTPAIEFTHAHSERAWRKNKADTEAGLNAALDRFREKWGFDRLAPDLDEVARRYAGTPLLWNANVFGPAATWPEPRTDAIELKQTEWQAYAERPALRQGVDARIGLVTELLRGDLAATVKVLHVGARAGLIAHLLAQRGIAVEAVDTDRAFVEFARKVCSNHSYSGAKPVFLPQVHPTLLPQAAGSVDVVLLLDLLEWHHNPAGLLAEAHRVLKPGGRLVVVTSERASPLDAEPDRQHPYRAHEINAQVANTRLFTVAQSARAGSGTLTVIATHSETQRDHVHFRPEATIEVQREAVKAALPVRTQRAGR